MGALHNQAISGEPGDLARIGIGAWLAAASNMILVAAIGATGGVLVLLFGRALNRVFASGANRPLRPSAMTIEVER